MNSTTPEDRNFDDLAHRFKRNVYSSLKGKVRLHVLDRDFQEFLPHKGDQPWRVLDAGGGQGQMAAYFAARGDEVLLCDISAEMLKLAREHLVTENLSERVTLCHGAIQDVLAREEGFDLIVCHAVLEWVVDPQALLQKMTAALKPGGFLSLSYYNLNGLVYKNLLRTNFKKLRKEKWSGYRGSLTPTAPLRPEQVADWLRGLPLEVLCESGIRVFYDYIFNEEDRRRDPEGIVEMELKYSRTLPFKHLGRYIHLLCRKSG
ncbi:methyltransferase domain-containing protein [Gilvimarinus sp. F26214L]|uniref:methyltransferase domain-containing protein n=1 Tax=Gilvimarinus sp. DZF01 TaxID=3461371 RepID=UPI00404677BF